VPLPSIKKETMPQVHRMGDPNDAGAPIVSVPQSTVFVNGRIGSVDGSSVAGHGKNVHSSPKTANGSATVFFGGIPANRQGDADTCGHTRTSGSPDMIVG